jgi:multiple antibiotic resistance protein
MLTEAALASFAAALFSMMNPVGNVGVIAGMTALSEQNRLRRAAQSRSFAE